MKQPKTVIPAWDAAFRMVSSAFPPITLFEDLLDPGELEMAYALEALTNDRLQEECGVLNRVPVEDRVSGPGSTPVMAAFTHIGKASRFTDGTYGIYYAANSQAAAIAETSFHQQRFLAATNEPDIELTLRTVIASRINRDFGLFVTCSCLPQRTPYSAMRPLAPGIHASDTEVENE